MIPHLTLDERTRDNEVDRTDQVKPTVINVTYEECQEGLDWELSRAGLTEEEVVDADCNCCPSSEFKGTYEQWDSIRMWRELRGPKRSNP